MHHGVREWRRGDGVWERIAASTPLPALVVEAGRLSWWEC